jgi:hypothetical protein
MSNIIDILSKIFEYVLSHKMTIDYNQSFHHFHQKIVDLRI